MADGLGPLKKKFVWLSLLCVAREMGTHHLKLFFHHGGTDRQADAAFRIAGWVNPCSSYESVEGSKAWASLPSQDGLELPARGSPHPAG